MNDWMEHWTEIKWKSTKKC